LANRRWSLRKEPFPHAFVDEVFVPEFAAELDAACAKVLSGERLRHFGWYDAHAWNFSETTSGPLRVFITPEWRDMVASVLGVRVTPHVAGGIHHHDIGSANGMVHSDYNPVYFPLIDEPAGDRKRPAAGAGSRRRAGSGTLAPVQLSQANLVGYTTGVAERPGVEIVPVARAVVFLYYLGNEPWVRGDGGETGLYRRSSDPVDRPAAAIPPRNNTLVAFECTPSSFHSFITNRRLERNCVIAWFHRTIDEVESRWGSEALERWKV
jgi:hypothetical protein